MAGRGTGTLLPRPVMLWAAAKDGMAYGGGKAVE